MANNIPSDTTYKKIAEWLDIYHSTDSVRKKNQAKTFIVGQMIPVVKHIAKTIARRSYDPIEDMIQAGFIGLLKAIDNYSKEKNDNFRVYAGYLIIGEMKHFLRDKLNTIRVPRHIQELCIRISNFTKDLTPEELEILTTDEVATALDTSKEAIDFAMQIDRRRSTLSLDEVYRVNSSNLSYEEILAENNYKEKAENRDAKIWFEEIIYKVPEEERIVLDMYYKQDMTQKEIAEALQITHMAVSRKMKKAFSIIANLMNEKDFSNNKEDL